MEADDVAVKPEQLKKKPVALTKYHELYKENTISMIWQLLFATARTYFLFSRHFVSFNKMARKRPKSESHFVFESRQWKSRSDAVSFLSFFLWSLVFGFSKKID